MGSNITHILGSTNFYFLLLEYRKWEGEPRIYDARSKCSGVPLTTFIYCDYRQPSKEEKA